MGTILVLSGSKKRPAGLVRERVLGRVSHLGCFILAGEPWKVESRRVSHLPFKDHTGDPGEDCKRKEARLVRVSVCRVRGRETCPSRRARLRLWGKGTPELGYKGQSLPCNGASPLLGVPPEGLKTGTQNRYLYTRILSSITHSSQKAEATQVSINR